MTDTAQTPTRPRTARVARSSRSTNASKPKTSTAPPTVVLPATEPTATTEKTPRAGSRLAAIVALMRRPEGATLDALVEATGWQRHSVRGALSGALKKTYCLTITSSLEDGVRVYRIASEGADA